MGLKGFSLTVGTEGIYIYGGVYWQETNLTFMDIVYTQTNKFYESCRNKMNERSLIEQASAALDGGTYLELSIDDIGTDRWTE